MSMDVYRDKTLAWLRHWPLETYLVVSLCVLGCLLMFQGARCGVAGIRAVFFARSLDIDPHAVPPRVHAKALDAYDAILDKGLLGKRVKQAPPEVKLLGVLGRQALLGPSSEGAKAYEVGGEVPGGEKIVEITSNSVVLEKEGKQRTLKVFPDSGAGPARKEEPPSAPEPSRAGEKKEVPPVEDPPPAPEPADEDAAPEEEASGGLAGSSWSADGATISFSADGTMTISQGSHSMQGSWSVSGSTITVTIGNETATGQIDGNTMTIEGKQLQRVS